MKKSRLGLQEGLAARLPALRAVAGVGETPGIPLDTEAGAPVDPRAAKEGASAPADPAGLKGAAPKGAAHADEGRPVGKLGEP